MTPSPMDEKFGSINQNLAENFDLTSKELFFELVIILALNSNQILI
jgi:hypothetical protein